MAFLPLFLTILAWGVPIGLGWSSALLWDRLSRCVLTFALAIVCAVGVAEAVGLVCLVAAIAYFRVHVGTWGVYCSDRWGLYHEAEWADIVAVRSVNFLGLR